MDSTSSMTIMALIIGIIILGGLWAWASNRVTGDVPPPKVEDRPRIKPEPLVVPPEPEVASKPAPKAKGPAAKKPVADKAVVIKTPAPKPAAKKAPPSKAPGKTAAAPAPLTAIGVPGAVGAPDNLLLIKGLGPKLNTLLLGLGITRFDQIGGWNTEDVARVDEHLGAFKGRIERDSWIEQAGLLAKGAIAEFEAKFGKLDSENK